MHLKKKNRFWIPHWSIADKKHVIFGVVQRGIYKVMNILKLIHCYISNKCYCELTQSNGITATVCKGLSNNYNIPVGSNKVSCIFCLSFYANSVWFKLKSDQIKAEMSVINLPI